MSKQLLDFIIIGAAKSGTTTLHELLKQHPDIHLPEGKEYPFFSNDRLYKKGFKKFISSLYGDAPESLKWGKATPQYMTGQDTTMPDSIAKRINNTIPNVKLIAIMRNPIDRGFSYYRMSKRLGYEDRTFDKAIEELLEPKALEKSRKERDWRTVYVTPGEYGRILSYYYELFPSENILTLFTEDLKNDPKKVLREIYRFLEIDDSFIPNNAGEKFHQGGSSPKFKFLTPGFIYKMPFVKKFWQDVVPFNIRGRVNSIIEHWNIRTESEKIELSDENRQKLKAHFKPDIEILEKLIGKNVPWDKLR